MVFYFCSHCVTLCLTICWLHGNEAWLCHMLSFSMRRKTTDAVEARYLSVNHVWGIRAAEVLVGATSRSSPGWKHRPGETDCCFGSTVIAHNGVV